MARKKKRAAAGKAPGVVVIVLALILALGGYTVLAEDVLLPEQWAFCNGIITQLRGSLRGTDQAAQEGITIYTGDDLPAARENQLRVTALNVGQGLSVLVGLNDHYLIYDGGGRSRSSYVVSYLEQHGVDELDYLVASHYDEDHIAGLVGVLNTTAVDTAITPDYSMDTKIYRSFREMLAANGAAEIHPQVGQSFTLDGAQVQVLSPASFDHENKNDNSIVVRISYGEFSCLITGDAETDIEEELLTSGYTLNSDVYVVGHHGSSSSSSPDFVRAVSPEYALISVGAGNKYGHPTQQTLDTLMDNHVTVYRTDESSEVTVCYTPE